MVLNTLDLKNACSKILAAIDNNGDSSLVGMLELITKNGNLYLNVTNREYFVEVILGPCAENFHATINAELFLKLTSQLTAEDIELTANESTLFAVTNTGKYKFPIIYDGADVLTLPQIIINNPSVNMNIEGDVLYSILVNNSKELSKLPKDPKIKVPAVKRYYYVDEQGAVTFYNGACVNKFTLEKPVKMMLNSKLVKLFSLLRGKTVNFTLGHDALSSDIIQTKVQFKCDDVCITAVLNSDDSLVQKMPAAAVREKAFSELPYSITVNRAALLSAIQRLTIFTTNAPAIGSYTTCSKVIFNQLSLIMKDYNEENAEEVKYANEISTQINYEALVDMTDFKLAIESSKDQYVTISFGDNDAMILAKDNVYTLIPEIYKE